MSLFLIFLREASEDHAVEGADDGSFTIYRKPGREGEFDELARRVLNTDNGFAAFPRSDGDGFYDGVHIIPDAQ